MNESKLLLIKGIAGLGKLLRENLVLHPRIRKRVDQFKKDLFQQKTVGVHIHYTDKRAPLLGGGK